MRACALFLAVAAASAQTHNFESDDIRWIALGGNGKLHITHEAAEVKSGSGALAFEYDVVPKAFSVALTPTPDGIAKMISLRFWVKSKASTALGVVLSEKKPGGGDYTAVFWVPKGEWQRVELFPPDFAANEGPTDPKDSDGKLDLDQVQAIGIVDLAFLLASLPDNPDFPLAVDRPKGARSIFVDDFEVSSQASAEVTPGNLVIDNFRRPMLRWFTLGGAELSLLPKSPLEGPALQATYQQTDSAYAAIIHRISGVDLARAAELSLDIASVETADILVSIEESRPGHSEGPRFNYTIDVPGGRHPVKKTIRFADFKPDNISSEEHLNPARIKTISLVDITAASEARNHPNTLWIGNVTAGSGVK